MTARRRKLVGDSVRSLEYAKSDTVLKLVTEHLLNGVPGSTAMLDRQKLVQRAMLVRTSDGVFIRSTELRHARDLPVNVEWAGRIRAAAADRHADRARPVFDRGFPQQRDWLYVGAAGVQFPGEFVTGETTML